MKEAVRSLFDRLPWGMRKLAAFVVLHGPFGLLRSKPHFTGVYPSFDKVPNKRAANRQVLVRAAENNVGRLKRDGATNLPILGQSHSLLALAVAILATQQPFRILDFGGAAGADFHNLTSAIPDFALLDYHVVDLPEVCAASRSRWKGEKRIRFSDEMPMDGEQFDLVYSSWAVLYVAKPMDLLEKFASYNARAILLVNVPFTRHISFVRVQTNYMIPSWVLSLDDAERVMRDRGYNLAFHVAGDIDHNVDNYSPEFRVSNMTNLLFLKS